MTKFLQLQEALMFYINYKMAIDHNDFSACGEHYGKELELAKTQSGQLTKNNYYQICQL